MGSSRNAVVRVRTAFACPAVCPAVPPEVNGDATYPSLLIRSELVHLTLAPDGAATIVRPLGHENHARMGSYAEALARA